MGSNNHFFFFYSESVLYVSVNPTTQGDHIYSLVVNQEEAGKKACHTIVKNELGILTPTQTLRVWGSLLAVAVGSGGRNRARWLSALTRMANCRFS